MKNKSRFKRSIVKSRRSLKGFKLDKTSGQTAFWAVVIIAIFVFGKKMMSAISGIFPTDTKAEHLVQQQNEVNSLQNTLNSIVKKNKLTYPNHVYEQIANAIYDVIDKRNYLTGSYNNRQLRDQFYLLQNTSDWLKLQIIWGVRDFTYGILPPRTEHLTLAKLGILMDNEDKKYLNQRFSEKKIAYAFL